MRIAQVAPIAESVPPELYGGTERVVSWLTEELVAAGHDVTLFASGDSRTSAKLFATAPRALRLGGAQRDLFASYALHLEAVAEAVSSFDVIHFHIDWIHLPLMTRLKVPHLTTVHCRTDLPEVQEVAMQFPAAPLVSVSNQQRRLFTDANWVGTIHHGMPVPPVEPARHPGDYLVFLGRITKDKGPDVAIRLARAAGMPLRIAAKIPRMERQYFKECIEPYADGEQIRLEGEVGDAAKFKLLQGAAALLFPIDWPEPFGLVLIEAMACGTPVIAFRRGAVPEIVEDGVTGFIVDNDEEAVRAIRQAGELNRRQIRARFEQRFTAKRMASDYVRLYQALIKPPRVRAAAKVA